MKQQCDCHTHVFAHVDTFALSPQRTYTPGLADVGMLARYLRDTGLERVVIVQPSVYGFDNRALLHAIAALGPSVARGVAAIDLAHVADAELDRLAAGGVCGVRLNFETDRTPAPEAGRLLRAAAQRLAGRGWHLQVHAGLRLTAALSTVFPTLGLPVVLDHYGGTHAATAPDHPDFVQLLAAVRSGKVHVKLSAGHLCGVFDDDFARLEPLARALIAANADRLVWGSDWPHPDPGAAPCASPGSASPLRHVDDRRALAMLRQCVPDQATLEKIMVSNPARLYGFESIQPAMAPRIPA